MEVDLTPAALLGRGHPPHRPGGPRGPHPGRPPGGPGRRGRRQRGLSGLGRYLIRRRLVGLLAARPASRTSSAATPRRWRSRWSPDHRGRSPPIRYDPPGQRPGQRHPAPVAALVGGRRADPGARRRPGPRRRGSPIPTHAGRLRGQPADVADGRAHARPPPWIDRGGVRAHRPRPVRLRPRVARPGAVLAGPLLRARPVRPLRVLEASAAGAHYLRGPRRWVLKSPQHLEQLGPLLATFPDATIAFTLRDPVAVLQSAITMLAYGDRTGG